MIHHPCQTFSTSLWTSDTTVTPKSHRCRSPHRHTRLVRNHEAVNGIKADYVCVCSGHQCLLLTRSGDSPQKESEEKFANLLHCLTAIQFTALDEWIIFVFQSSIQTPLCHIYLLISIQIFCLKTITALNLVITIIIFLHGIQVQTFEVNERVQTTYKIRVQCKTN